MLGLQILLRHRATKVNAQMYDGTTPLMVAVRLAVEGMVEELISADADVNATDTNGKCRFAHDVSAKRVDQAAEGRKCQINSYLSINN